MLHLKPIARYAYAHIPGLADLRFAFKDATASFLIKPEYRLLSSLQINAGMIIDIGAHRGHSIAAFRRLAPQATVIAFEPDPRAIDRLKARYRNDKMVSIWPFALGDKGGTTTFYFPTYGHWDCDGMGALSESEATEWLRDRKRMLHFKETKLRVSKWPVPMKTLDCFSLQPSLIKLHAQGAELSILQGAEQTIRNCEPALMVAFPTVEVDDLLTSWNYRQRVARTDTFVWYLTDRFQRTCPDQPSR